MKAKPWIYKVVQSGEDHEENDDQILISSADLDELIVEKIGPGKYHILKDNKSIIVESVSINLEMKSVDMTVNGIKQTYIIQDKLDILIEKMGLDIAHESHHNEILAPMPGTVLSVEVSENQEVSKGQTLIILEAMKMENTIKAHSDSKIQTIHIKKGDAVDKDQLLVTL